MKVLLGQLNANGDCLYATILARQIKKDFPECELTWAISNQCRNVLKNNPYVDHLWEFSVNGVADRERAWWALEERVLRTQASPEAFDKVVLSQISPGNFRHYDGTIRTSVLRAYQDPITVPIDSVIVLDDSEKQSVDTFVRLHAIDQFDHRVLFECSSSSGQSYVTPSFALEVAKIVSKKVKNCCFILSTHETLASSQENVFFARELGMRENAELTHHCSLFVGCGSGLTVVATSSIAKEIPNIQLLAAETSVYASFHHDFEWFGKSTDRFIEMADAPAELVGAAIISCCRDGLEKTKSQYHSPISLTFDFYCKLIDTCLLRKEKYYDALQSLETTIRRYGWCDQLAVFGKTEILPYLHCDKLETDPESRLRMEEIVSYFQQMDPSFKRVL